MENIEEKQNMAKKTQKTQESDSEKEPGKNPPGTLFKAGPLAFINMNDFMRIVQIISKVDNIPEEDVVQKLTDSSNKGLLLLFPTI